MTNSSPLSLEELELALILAQSSELAYSSNLDSRSMQNEVEISIFKYFDYNTSSQWNVAGFWGSYKDYLLVSFRGTNNFGDWKKNFQLSQNHQFCLDGGIDGIKTHYGFSQTVAGGWEDFLRDLQFLLQQKPSQNHRSLLLTGHSLGGALAILTAYRLSFLPEFSSKIRAVYTYGAPRVGNSKFRDSCKVDHYRFNYGNDPVPALPPYTAGYHHHGQLYYLPKDDPAVILKNDQSIQSYKALFNVLQGGIKIFLFKDMAGLIELSKVSENVADHNIERYIEHIKGCRQFIEIIQGLKTGSLSRSGGTIRDRKTDQIVGHLFESKGVTEPLPLVLGKSSLVPNAAKGIPIQMSQLPMGASVLNLGASLVGFAYMARKLSQVQRDLDNIKRSVEAGFDHIDDQLKELHGQLAYISVLVERNVKEQIKLGESISVLHRALLVENMAALRATLLDRSRYPDSPVKEALLVTSKTRDFMSDQSLCQTPTLDAGTILLTDIAVKGWVVAISTEVNLLLEVGRISDAEQVLNEEIPRFRNMAFKWLNALLISEEPQLKTVYRFAAPIFEQYIAPERVERITRISQMDSSLTPEKIRQKKQDAEIELDLTSSPYRENKDWISRQLAIAEYLDMLSELLARLESLQAFALLCKSKNLNDSRELLRGLDAEPGLYIFPVV